MSCRVSVSMCEIVMSLKMALFQTWMAKVSTDPWSSCFSGLLVKFSLWLAMVACWHGGNTGAGISF